MPVFVLLDPSDVNPKGVYRITLHPDIVATLIKIGYDERKYWTDVGTEMIIDAIKKTPHWPMQRVKEAVEQIEDEVKSKPKKKSGQIPKLPKSKPSKPDTSEPS